MEGKGFLERPALWIAVIGAVVAGVFSALFYEHVINVKSLDLRESRSGVIVSDSEKQIFIVEIENSGGEVLKNVEYLFNLNDATFEDVSISAPFYAETAVTRNANGSLGIVTSELDGGDVVKISFLLSGKITSSTANSIAKAEGVPPVSPESRDSSQHV